MCFAMLEPIECGAKECLRRTGVGGFRVWGLGSGFWVVDPGAWMYVCEQVFATEIGHLL